MQRIENWNPVTTAVWFAAVAGTVMLTHDPLLLLLSLVGAILLFSWREKTHRLRTHIYAFLFFLVLSLINPLVSHRGETVLFVLNRNPVTLEALLYGMASAAMITAVLYWFRSFGELMTSDKLLYLFSRLSPRLALVFSMGLRYVPLLSQKAKQTEQTQRALGLYRDGTLLERIRGGARVFSVLLGWSLENGITTADSMRARGYGEQKRTYYTRFSFGSADICILSVTACLLVMTLIPLAMGDMRTVYYPTLSLPAATPLAVIGYICYGLLVLLPTLIELEEAIRWSCLRSSI